jgi:hypothetical protein
MLPNPRAEDGKVKRLGEWLPVKLFIMSSGVRFALAENSGFECKL